MKVRIVPAEEAHIAPLVTNARAHERSFEDAEKILAMGLQRSALVRTALFDDEPACMWGIFSTTVLGENHLWLYTTKLIEQHPRVFLVRSRRFIREALEIYGTLNGFVNCRYARSHLWLQWLGFVPIGTFDSVEGKVVKYELRYGD